MEKKTFWIIAGVSLAVLVLLVIWQTVQISAIGAGSGTTAVKAAATTAASASSGMVGGC